MKQLTAEHIEKLTPWLPVQRGNVKLATLNVLNAILYMAAQGCAWRALPERYGPWHTVYTRLNRWAKNGVLEQLFLQLQKRRLVHIEITAVSLDSTSIKVHPDAAGAQKKTDRKPSAAPAADEPPKFIWLPRMSGRP